jgi:dTDP-4-dehydrorhamnose reductase
MRLLIFGGTGLLGSAIAREARRRDWPVLALSHRQADITRREAGDDWARRFRPQAILDCAAFAQVDLCESEPERAMAVNGHAVEHLADLARRGELPLVYVSSDYVFDGRSTAAYDEDAPTAPLSVYGRSKRLGEEIALAYPRSLVVRTSWLFGPDGSNFVLTILRLAMAGQQPLRVVDDQVGRPTYAPYLAKAILDLLARDRSGLVHYANRDAVSWFEFARAIVENWGLEVAVEPAATREVPRPAVRPARSVLATGRFARYTSRPPESWRCGLEQLRWWPGFWPPGGGGPAAGASV